MKISMEIRNSTVFGLVKDGEVFLYKDDVLMRCLPVFKTGYNDVNNAVSLKDGNFYSLDETATVERVSAKLSISYSLE